MPAGPRPPRRYDYVDDGPAIYLDSFATIRRETDLSGLPADAEKLAVKLSWVAGGLLLAWAVWFNLAFGPANGAAHAITWVLALLAGVSVMGAAVLSGRGRDGWAFIATGGGIVAMMVATFIKMYGNIGFVSSGEPGLDMWSASSSPYTLKIMTVAAAIFVPIVLAYQAWSYWVFRRRISVANMPDETPAGDPVPTPA